MLTAALLLLAACTQNELSDGSQGETLPEGKYPLTFNASIDGEAVAATPQTRASSVDGDATSLDYIGVGAYYTEWGTEYYVETSYFQHMIFEKDGNTWKYHRAMKYNGDLDTPKNPPYWSNKSDYFRVKAWYFKQNGAKGEGYDNKNNPDYCDNFFKKNEDYFQTNFIWNVLNDQSGDGYANSDFLYAQDMITLIGSNYKTLHFFHQTSKVVVHIIKGSQTPADITSEKISMTIGSESNNVPLTGHWKRPDRNALFNDGQDISGKWTIPSDPTYGTITPKNFTPEPDIKLGSGEERLASYEALVIPQKINKGKQLFVINIEGYAPFYYTPADDINWSASSGSEKCGGVEFTYYITIKGSSLSVTTSSSIGWTDGASGSGSVTFIGDKMAKDAEIGDFYMSDGTLVNSEATLTDKQKAACIGIVYCVDKTFIKDESTKKSEFPHGLVVALKDAGPCSWDNIQNAVPDFPNLPANNSGWYVPNKAELLYICRGSNNKTQSVNGRDMLNGQFNKLNRADAKKFSIYYWSNTQYFSEEDKAWIVDFNSGADNTIAYKNGNMLLVRYAFAF